MSNILNKSKLKNYFLDMQYTIEKSNNALKEEGDNFIKLKRLIGEHKLELIGSMLEEMESGRFDER